MTRPQIHAHLADEPGIRFGIATGVLVATLFVAGVARPEVSETEFLTVILAGLVTVGLPLAMTAWISIVALAVLTRRTHHVIKENAHG